MNPDEGRIVTEHRDRLEILDRMVWQTRRGDRIDDQGGCAGEQDRFWDYHDALFTHTAGSDRGVFTRPRLKAYAAEVGLDMREFSTCIDSGRYESGVRAESEQGRLLGVKSTPTLVINGRLVSPVPAFDELRALIAPAGN